MYTIFHPPFYSSLRAEAMASSAFAFTTAKKMSAASPMWPRTVRPFSIVAPKKTLPLSIREANSAYAASGRDSCSCSARVITPRKRNRKKMLLK